MGLTSIGSLYVERTGTIGCIPRSALRVSIQSIPAGGTARSYLSSVRVQVARIVKVVLRNAVRVTSPIGLDIGAIPPKVAVDKRVGQDWRSNGEGESPCQHCFAQHTWSLHNLSSSVVEFALFHGLSLIKTSLAAFFLHRTFSM